jgi:hypothetical protein
MARIERFTFACNENERRAIACLAKQLARSQSDAVRFVIVEAERQLSQEIDSSEECLQPDQSVHPVKDPKK